jgi:hypothetical protein
LCDGFEPPRPKIRHCPFGIVADLLASVLAAEVIE